MVGSKENETFDLGVKGLIENQKLNRSHMKIDLNDVISGNTTSNQKNHMNLKEKIHLI